MYRIMIIEDEPLLLKGLIKTIQWEAYGFQIAGTANCAEKALELLKEIKPDVILTDIVMPEHDGLWLLEKMKALLPDAYSIILSNHAQFNYAHRAIQLGVYEYVVKLDLYEKLPQILLCLKEKIDQKTRTSAGESRELARALEQRLSPPFGGFHSYGIIACLHAPRENALPGCLQYSQVAYTGYRGMFVIAVAGSNQAKARQALHEVADLVKYNNVLGISLAQDNEDISACYYKAVKMLDYAQLIGQNFGIYEETNPRMEFLIDNKKDIDAAASFLVGGNPTEFVKVISKIIRNCICTRNVLVGTPRAMLAGLFGRLTEVYTSSQIKDVFDNYIHTFYTIDSMISLISYVNENAPGMERYLDDYRKLSKNNMRDILAYIDANLTKSMKLEDIARHFFMSPPYFSLQFKKCTGTKFSDYIKKLNLEKAAEYLKSSVLSISEVADMVGYQDTKHFSKIFKERFGIIPSEYKAASIK